MITGLHAMHWQTWRVLGAVVKDDRQPPFVAMPLDDFLELVREWWPGVRS